MGGDPLPPGRRCADCAHFLPICSWLLAASRGGHETRCDWAPSRFRLVREAPPAHFRCQDCGETRVIRSVREGWPHHCGTAMAFIMGEGVRPNLAPAKEVTHGH